ncbi:hypothetical protein IAI18_05275 [Acetobacteraceae bacterium H6797]|nr:hypothetical protein [Acetobacteraceae bacterium H6797]
MNQITDLESAVTFARSRAAEMRRGLLAKEGELGADELLQLQSAELDAERAAERLRQANAAEAAARQAEVLAAERKAAIAERKRLAALHDAYDKAVAQWIAVSETVLQSAEALNSATADLLREYRDSRQTSALSATHSLASNVLGASLPRQIEIGPRRLVTERRGEPREKLNELAATLKQLCPLPQIPEENAQ